MRIVDCEQGSAQWLAERVGRVTASRISEALSKFKREKKTAEETAERWNYRVDMVAERMTGRSTENFVSPEMLWGREYEEEADQAYELEKGIMTRKVGFIIHPRFDWMGASPDSLVGNDGGHEIKCPKTTTHIKWYFEYLKHGIVPPEHQPQVLCNIACAEREWWDFSSYDPRMQDGNRLFTVRMYRDEQRIKAMEDDAERFHEETEAVIAELRQRVKVTPVEEVPPLEDWATRFAEFTGMDEIPL